MTAPARRKWEHANQDSEIVTPATRRGSEEVERDELLATITGPTNNVTEVLPFKLSFAIHDNVEHTREMIKENPALHYFSTTHHECASTLIPDCNPSLGSIVQFCQEVRERLEDARISNRHFIYYCYAKKRHVANSALLLACYLVLEKGWDAARAAQRFASLDQVAPTQGLTLFDHLSGLQRAQNSGFLSLNDFDKHEYDFLQQKRMHFVCPKFAALHDPVDALDQYLQIFNAYDISTVVRLNGSRTYAKNKFVDAGISHYDLYFKDGTAPSLKLVEQFLGICKQEDVIAVHCIAGLGRTGTLIAVWIMREYSWTARDAIAWLRMVRPGSINDVQYSFLLRYESLVRNYCHNIPDPNVFLTRDLSPESSPDQDVRVHTVAWQSCPLDSATSELSSGSGSDDSGSASL